MLADLFPEGGGDGGVAGSGSSPVPGLFVGLVVGPCWALSCDQGSDLSGDVFVPALRTVRSSDSAALDLGLWLSPQGGSLGSACARRRCLAIPAALLFWKSLGTAMRAGQRCSSWDPWVLCGLPKSCVIKPVGLAGLEGDSVGALVPLHQPSSAGEKPLPREPNLGFGFVFLTRRSSHPAPAQGPPLLLCPAG